MVDQQCLGHLRRSGAERPERTIEERPRPGPGAADAGQARLRTLWGNDLVRRVVAVKDLKRSLLVGASGLGLLVLAVLIVLTNAVTLVITLAIVALIIFLLFRWGMTEGRRTKFGG